MTSFCTKVDDVITKIFQDVFDVDLLLRKFKNEIGKNKVDRFLNSYMSHFPNFYRKARKRRKLNFRKVGDWLEFGPIEIISN